MRLGALAHLADVGIAVNLAFSILDIYRGWIATRIAGSINDTLKSVEEAFTAVAAGTSSGQSEPQREVASVRTDLENGVSAWLGRTVRVAMLSAGVLAIFLVCAAVHEDAEVHYCNAWGLAFFILFLGVAPVLGCWIAMRILFWSANGQLKKIKEKYKGFLETYRSIQAASLTPTDPGPLPGTTIPTALTPSPPPAVD